MGTRVLLEKLILSPVASAKSSNVVFSRLTSVSSARTSSALTIHHHRFTARRTDDLEGSTNRSAARRRLPVCGLYQMILARNIYSFFLSTLVLDDDDDDTGNKSKGLLLLY